MNSSLAGWRMTKLAFSNRDLFQSQQHPCHLPLTFRDYDGIFSAVTCTGAANVYKWPSQRTLTLTQWHRERFYSTTSTLWVSLHTISAGNHENICQIWCLTCGQLEQLVSAGHIATRVHQSQLCSLSFGLSCGSCTGVVVLPSILSGGGAFFCSISTQKLVLNAFSWSVSDTLKVAFSECDVKYAPSSPLPLGAWWRGGLCEWRLLVAAAIFLCMR